MFQTDGLQVYPFVTACRETKTNLPFLFASLDSNPSSASSSILVRMKLHYRVLPRKRIIITVFIRIEAAPQIVAALG